MPAAWVSSAPATISPTGFSSKYASRGQTERPFGVNIALTSPFVDGVIDVIVSEGVPVVTTGGGDPGMYIGRFRDAGIKVMPVVASVAGANAWT